MSDAPIIEARGLNLWYGPNHALKDISVAVPAHEITAFIGPSGCGKSTFMRRVGAAMERAGERIVYINCSGDPDSLDAAIFLDRNAAIVDGTSPHGTASLGHPAKKVSICKALRGRKYDGSSTCHGTNRTLLQDKLFEVRRNCSIKKTTRYRL